MKIAAKTESLICVGSVPKNTCKAPGFAQKKLSRDNQEQSMSNQANQKDITQTKEIGQ